MTKPIVDQILDMPSAPKVLKELGKLLEEEQRRRQEFYEQVTDQEKAEFINGEIIIHSPVKKEHSDVSKRLGRLIDVYVDKNDLGFVGIEKVMISLTRNDYEPDVCFFKKDKASLFKKGQSKFPAPDLIIEILSKRTEDRDRGIKFEDYQEHEVAEYWLIDPKEEVVEQYHLEKGKYMLKLKAKTGEIDSFILKGFTIPIRSIFDKKINLQVLTQILGEDE